MSEANKVLFGIQVYYVNINPFKKDTGQRWEQALSQMNESGINMKALQIKYFKKKYYNISAHTPFASSGRRIKTQKEAIKFCNRSTQVCACF